MKPFDFKWRLWRVGGNVECFSSWVCVVEFFSWCSCRRRVADRQRPYRGLEIIDVLQEGDRTIGAFKRKYVLLYLHSGFLLPEEERERCIVFISKQKVFVVKNTVNGRVLNDV